MHSGSVEQWTHGHVFLGERHGRNERRTWAVVALASTMMVAEIVGGALFGSLALVADGWHMSTHAAALGIAALAYRLARTHARDPRFTFGTGKLGELAGFASAIILGLVAILIAYESIGRLAHPVAIGFTQAIPIAIVGLAVNLASAWLLHDGTAGHGHSHGHHHEHGHEHGHHHHETAGHGHDTNARAAYVHVLADALTSVLAIGALLGAYYLGMSWLDPVMGLVGAAVILAWAVSLIRSSGAVLLDVVPALSVETDIRARLELDGDRVTDLHLWQVGPGHRAAVVSIVSDRPQPPSAYKRRLAGLHDLSHLTVEVEPCDGGDHHHVHAA